MQYFIFCEQGVWRFIFFLHVQLISSDAVAERVVWVQSRDVVNRVEC